MGYFHEDKNPREKFIMFSASDIKYDRTRYKEICCSTSGACNLHFLKIHRRPRGIDKSHSALYPAINRQP